MPLDVILALDQGSSRTRCVAYDRRMRQRGAAVRRVSTYRPSSGMVEHDADELLAGTMEGISEVVAEVGAPVAGIGIASQTESFVLWERGTGRSVTPASLGAEKVGSSARPVFARMVAASARPPIDAHSSPARWSCQLTTWLFDADAALRERAEAGELLFGDIASWLAWHLCDGAAHLTEPSNACRSLLVDLATTTGYRRSSSGGKSRVSMLPTVASFSGAPSCLD